MADLITGATIGAGAKVLDRVIDKIPRKKNMPPKKTLRIVPQPHGTWWHTGATGPDGKPAMQVVCKCYVTNITSRQVIITTAFIKRPKTEAILPLTKHPSQNVYGGYPVLPNSTTELSLDFFVQPPKRKANKTFKASLVVKDQFGNKHKLRRVVFKYR